MSNKFNNLLPPSIRNRTVTAVLGPTNTGKTHLAIEKMVGHETGMIGLPLRLLAREVYMRVADQVGNEAVALITGEEKIVPDDPRYWISTVEAMPVDIETDFVAIDEVQLASDFERGHKFTHRILNIRGSHETLLLGAATIRPLLEQLLPGINVVTRPRMSVLRYAGVKKITRLPPRSAAVAFSADEVYAIAELVRRQRGGAAVVLGSLSPRTRNAQVELFQSGDVDILVATDAIGMGLNLDLDHIAFAGTSKFDGYQYRHLTPAEMGQIAGRAGRHLADGTFGVTGRAEPLNDKLVQLLESHQFEPLKVIQWRNSNLDFSSLNTLQGSLEKLPTEAGLTRVPATQDLLSLETAIRDEEIKKLANSEETVKLLWEVCQIPDYRKIAPANHAELVSTIFTRLVTEGEIPEDWFANQVSYANRIEGDIDTLANRIAHIRTWTYVANHGNWLQKKQYWQDETRTIENRLSDALHEQLIQRFVDRRTSVLMKRLRENNMKDAEITSTGDVLVEGQHIGQLHGFRFVPDATAEGKEVKAVRAAASKALSNEIKNRANKVEKAKNEEFIIGTDGTIRWLGEPIAKLIEGESLINPNLHLIADEQLSGTDRDKVQKRLDDWKNYEFGTHLKQLYDLNTGQELEGLARGLAYQLVENLGNIERRKILKQVKELDQELRGTLRRLGVRFGAYYIYIPALLKPKPSQLLTMLWILKNADFSMSGVTEIEHLAKSGRTSIEVDPKIDTTIYNINGYRVCGKLAVRIDILERLADIIRNLMSWKPENSDVEQPNGVIKGGGGFTVNVEMTSLLGCSGETFATVLKSLGYRRETQQISDSKTGSHANSCENNKLDSTKADSGDKIEVNTCASPQKKSESETQPEASVSNDPIENSDKKSLKADSESNSSKKATNGADISQDSDSELSPQTIEIWRPIRNNQKRRTNFKPKNQQNTDGSKAFDPNKKKTTKKNLSKPNSKPSSKQRQSPGKFAGKKLQPQKPKPKVADPNSPFAALADLKKQLENSKEKT